MTACEILAEVHASSEADDPRLQESGRLQLSRKYHCAMSMASHFESCVAESGGLFRVEGVQ